MNISTRNIGIGGALALLGICLVPLFPQIPVAGGGGAGGSTITQGGVSISDGMHLWGPTFALTSPTLTTFAWRNQDAATVSAANNTIYFSFPNAVTDSTLVGREQTVAVSTWTLTAAFLIFSPNTGSQNQNNGIYMADSGTNKIVYFHMDRRGIHYIQDWTNATSYSGQPFDGNFTWAPTGPLIWLKMQRTGGNVLFSVSADGINWSQRKSLADNEFLAAIDRVGFMMETSGVNNGDIDNAMTVVHWNLQ